MAEGITTQPFIIPLKADNTQAKKSLGGVRSDLQKTAAVGVSVAVGKVLIDLNEASKEFAKLETAGDSLVKSQGILNDGLQATAKSLVEGIQEASKGTIPKYDAMLAANKAMTFGLVQTQDDMEELTLIAQALGQSLGQSALKSLDDLTTGMGRQSKLILDNLGIIVSVGEANEAWAKANNRTVKSMSDQEKQMAFNNAVLKEGMKLVEQLGGTEAIAVDESQRLSASWEDMKIAVGDVVSGPLSEFLSLATEALNKTEEAANIFSDLSGQVATIDQLRLENFTSQVNQAAESISILLGQDGLAASEISEQIALLSGDINELTKEMVAGSSTFEEYQAKVQKLGSVSAPLAQQIELTKDQFSELNKEIRTANAQEKIAEINAEFSKMARQREFATTVVNGLLRIEEAATSSLFGIKAINEELIIAAQSEFLTQTRAAPFMATSAETGRANRVLRENAEAREDAKERANAFTKSFSKGVTDGLSKVGSEITNIITGGLDEIKQLGVLPEEGSVVEDARRLAAIAAGDFNGEAAKLLEQTRPDLVGMLFESGDPAGEAQRILQDFTMGVDSFGLLDKEAVKNRVRRTIFGTDNVNAIMQEIMGELQEEGFDLQQIQAAVGAEFAQFGQGVEAGIVSIEEKGKVEALGGAVVEFGQYGMEASNKFTKGLKEIQPHLDETLLKIYEMRDVLIEVAMRAGGAMGNLGALGAGLGVGAESGGGASVANNGGASIPSSNATPSINTGLGVAAGGGSQISVPTTPSVGGTGTVLQPVNMTLNGQVLGSFVVPVTQAQIERNFRSY
jgi:hypothetical protein